MKHWVARITIVAALAGGACNKDAKGPAGPAAAETGTGSAHERQTHAPEQGGAAAIRQAVDAADRSAEDRALDAGRHPAAVLAFFGIAPGQRVGEVFAGGGYTTELLARVVGDEGVVYGHNTKEILDAFARAPWTARLAKPAMSPVVASEQPLETPFPAEAKDLDAVVNILTYHDAVWLKADRATMNASIFAALRPGGVYGIVDHSAAAGRGALDVETLHRIDEDLVKQEILAAGFRLDGESDVLRNPDDARDWNSSPRAAADRRGTSDRFVLRFVKPE